MKYLATAILFLPRNEILSLLALLIMAIMFIGDLMIAREESSWR